MKKLYKPILIFCISFIFLGFNSCDVLEQLFLNLKVKQEFHATGNGPDIFDTVEDNLINYDAFNDNYDQIQSLKYVSAAYYTTGAIPSNLGGVNISAKIEDCAGNIILEQSLPTGTASDYINDPYEFILTEDEIAVFNNWLAEYKSCTQCITQDLCSYFYAEVRVEQVTPAGSGPYTLDGVVEIIIEIEAKLD
ncbi:MAG: hypothetical protein JSW63_03350 [Ignavibacterium sp.]|nr:MAG: hypothetical protein JSW63_03350 [Ignavibacterium sp.]